MTAYDELADRAQQYADRQNEAWIIYAVDGGKHFGSSSRENFPAAVEQAGKRGHTLTEREIVFPMSYPPVIICQGICESGDIAEAMEWIETVLDRRGQTLTDFPRFRYTNAEGMVHTLTVDISGTTDSNYEAGNPHFVFDEYQPLEDLFRLLEAS